MRLAEGLGSLPSVPGGLSTLWMPGAELGVRVHPQASAPTHSPGQVLRPRAPAHFCSAPWALGVCGLELGPKRWSLGEN